MSGMGYAKLWSSILNSTIWREDPTTKVVWITLLCMADKFGEVHSSVPGLADAARVSIEDTDRALAKFKSPDPHSRTPEYEGRRIADIKGGWLLLNFEEHRDRISKDQQNLRAAERAKRYRERKRAQTEASKGVTKSMTRYTESVTGSVTVAIKTTRDGERDERDVCRDERDGSVTKSVTVTQNVTQNHAKEGITNSLNLNHEECNVGVIPRGGAPDLAPWPDADPYSGFSMAVAPTGFDSADWDVEVDEAVSIAVESGVSEILAHQNAVQSVTARRGPREVA